MQSQKTRAQVLLEHLAHCIPGQCVDDFQLLGALLEGETFTTTVVTEVMQLNVASLPEHHNGNDPLSRTRVWQSEDGGIGDSGMAVEHLLNLDDGDVLCVADNDVLDPASDADIAGGVHSAQITRMEPSVDIE